MTQAECLKRAFTGSAAYWEGAMGQAMSGRIRYELQIKIGLSPGSELPKLNIYLVVVTKLKVTQLQKDNVVPISSPLVNEYHDYNATERTASGKGHVEIEAVLSMISIIWNDTNLSLFLI